MSDERLPPGPAPALASSRATGTALLWAGGFLALVAWSLAGTGRGFTDLLGREGWVQMGAYVQKLFPPDVSPRFLSEVAGGSVETFAMSLVGTVLAVVIALALLPFASSTLTHSGLLFAVDRGNRRTRASRMALCLAAKGILNILRTIPELVWALIFVFAVGLGPFPGVLALGVHTGGVLGKLFGEVVENVERRPLEALQSTGATRLQILLYGIFPQVLPQFIAYTLYRWEVNIRAAAILGFVGAGGLGQRIMIAISLFLENQLLTLLVAIYLLVTAVDYLSAVLRHRLA